MKNILITGATSGIGEQLARDYANAGHAVIACGRNREKLQVLQDEYPGLSGLAFDITRRDEVNRAAGSIGEDLDLVSLNAGDCEYIDDPMDFDAALFERIVRDNQVSLGFCNEVHGIFDVYAIALVQND